MLQGSVISDETPMPGDYHIDAKLRIVFLQAWGTYTDEEMLDLQQRTYADPNFDPSHNNLLDLSKVESALVTTEGIRTLISRSRWSAESRRAIVAPADHVFGLLRMEGSLREATEQPAETSVFRTQGEALNWLGIDEVDRNILPSSP